MIKLILLLTALVGIILILVSSRYSADDAKMIKGFGYSAIAVAIIMAVAFWS